jgi:leader peptidase (prepilin peptidase) / N-methyltransferase
VVVALAALAALLAGRYARTLAEGFAADPADTRAEARHAFLTALRTPPRPVWPPAVEVAAALAAALVAWRVPAPCLPAMLYAVFLGTVLTVTDLRTSRLPDVLTLPSYPLLAVLLIPSGEVPRALLGGLALAAVYGLLWFARPTAMGLGDVKLAGLIGMAAAALSWNAWIAAAVGGQLLGALYAALLLLTGRAGRDTEFPFGPFMLAGGLAAVCLAW